MGVKLKSKQAKLTCLSWQRIIIDSTAISQEIDLFSRNSIQSKLFFKRLNHIYYYVSSIDFSNDESNKFFEITRECINSTDIIVRHNFELVDGILHYKLEVNPNLVEKHHEDLSTPNEDNSIGSELIPKFPSSFTEQLFHKLI